MSALSGETPTEAQLWMRRCLALAQEAREHGDAPVGAVIVRQGVLVAEASEQVQARQDVAAHAELLAIQDACRALHTLRLPDCTLYTNVEPCWLCSFALRETGIGRVVIGGPVPDIGRVVIGGPVPDIGGITGRYPILVAPNIDGWGPPPEIVWLTPDDAG